jgi:peptidoglycan/xylan/chitin deacetylase (PgdA/CDA1 family)
MKLLKPYFVKTPRLVQHFFSDYSWRIKTKKKDIYLTFDDGPVPDFTPWVLDTLKKFEAKATFFCVGENIQKYPDIYERVIKDQHSVGNHTFNHLQGWKTSTAKYVKNILKAESYLQEAGDKKSIKLFRPPHGRIKPKQARALRKKGYKIIMWDVLSGDFDQRLSKESCLEHTIKHIESGSIVVFHDSVKSFKNLDYVLPKVLEHFSEKGYSFRPL